MTSNIRLSQLFVGLCGISMIALLACGGSKSAGDDNSGGGGDAGGDGGSSEGEGGKPGGASGSQGGKGGSVPGGSGGASGSGSGGSGGSTGGQGGGGPGGMSVGGAGGTMANTCTPNSMYAGKPDAEIPKDVLFCDATCIYRPNWPGHHVCGAGGVTFKSVDIKTDGFCGSQYNSDGVFEVDGGRLDQAAYNQAPNANGIVTNPVPGVGRAYLPGGPAGYAAAEAGKVAVTIWTSIMGSNDGYPKGVFRIENIHEYLVQRKEIPYTIAIFMDDDLGGADRIKQLRDQIFPALKAKWSKISDLPAYKSIAGQSTAGANAFDTIFMGTDVIAKGIGGSPSFACFTCLNTWGMSTDPARNQGYMKEIKFCPAKPIRWSGTVGTCDIYGSNDSRIEAGCPGTARGTQVDSSSCGASWLPQNQAVTAELKAKGLPHQLFVIKGGEHDHNTWGGVALANQLRWVFKDITCAK